ncbi:MAG: hypothetical protein PUB93_05660 [Firmicutes bacterium]|nr:hypothetical protein [Bacillota bacterium]
MKTSQDMLTSVLKTAQMGQTGIRSVLRSPMSESLEKALRSQLREYDTIETQAQAIASQRGWQLPELSPGLRRMARLTARARLSFGSSDARIAAMMVRGCVRGVEKGQKELRRYSHRDPQISQLSEALLACENGGIHRMEGFL